MEALFIADGLHGEGSVYHPHLGEMFAVHHVSAKASTCGLSNGKRLLRRPEGGPIGHHGKDCHGRISRPLAGATGDMNPVHFDEEYAKKTLFKSRVAHGVLSIGFISAVLGMKLPGEGTIFVSAKVEFKAPVRIGDTVVTTGTVKEIGERRRVVMDCLCTVNGNPVVTGEALVLAKKALRLAMNFPSLRRSAHRTQRRGGGRGQFRRRASGSSGADCRNPPPGEARNTPLAVLAFEPVRQVFRPAPFHQHSRPCAPRRGYYRIGRGRDVRAYLRRQHGPAQRRGFRHPSADRGLGLSSVVVGPDFEFGKGRAGSGATLKQMGEANGFPSRSSTW